MPPIPKWYSPVAVTALIWNLIGCLAYLGDVMLSPDDIAKMSADQQAMYASRTVWAVAATAVAVWFGAAGSLGLILKKRWALPLLIASLVGLIIQDIGIIFMTEAVSTADPSVFIIQGMVLLISISLVWLARTAQSRGWIPAQSVNQV